MSSNTGAAAETTTVSEAAPTRFTVKLTNFEGPFDLLLQLIGKHKLDVTEIALSKVTDEFIAHLKALGDELDLDQASEFLVVASTLLDLKAARLLPAAEVDAARRFPRDAALEQRFAELVPDVELDLTPAQFAALAARALAPTAPELVSVSHLHAPAVSVGEQLLLVRNHLVRAGTTTFRALTADCGHTNEVVARFLALLELYRQQRVSFEQLTPLGELLVRWTGGAVLPVDDPEATDTVDDYDAPEGDDA